MKTSIILIFLFLIAASTYRALSRKSQKQQEKAHNKSHNHLPKAKITNQQIIALSSASLDNPIYGEKPSLINAQMPGNSQAFNQRTIDSLVRRGYLKQDGKGGYLLTSEGADGLRSGMGF